MGKLGWKTIAGTFIIAISKSLGALGIVTEDVSAILISVGIVLGGIGLRHAVEKKKVGDLP